MEFSILDYLIGEIENNITTKVGEQDKGTRLKNLTGDPA